jgi:hypothetical protein
MTSSIKKLPSKVETVEQEAEASRILVETETELRRIEADRKALSVPTNKVLKEINEKSKAIAEPFEEAKAALQKALSDYRLTPEVQEKIAKRTAFERDFRKFEKEGDVKSMEIVSAAISRVLEEVPKSVKVEGSSLVVRYRESLKLDEVDEETLPEEFFDRVPNEKRIKERIDLIGAVPGVTHRFEMNPYCVETDK